MVPFIGSTVGDHAANLRKKRKKAGQTLGKETQQNNCTKGKERGST